MRGVVAAVVAMFASLVCLMGTPTPVSARPDGQALTPPMGWNSWNRFGCTINETIVRGVADAIVANGLDRLGYRYVTVDDCWMASARDSAGNLRADPVKFPSGMQALGDYLHTKGLKFGLYESPTEGTCQRRPGSYGHEQQDANTFAAWGVDYLKHDWCQTSPTESPNMWADFPNTSEKDLAKILFSRMGNALADTGRPIVYSLSACCSALDFPSWAGNVAHLWRTSTDINDSWNSVLFNYGRAVPFQAAAGPGHWNDPDMLEVGNGGMTTAEYRAHFNLWAMLAAPLIAGNDMRSMSADTRAILGNRAVIAIDQDPLGIPARRIADGETQVLARPLADGDRAVLLLNTGTTTRTVSTTTRQAGLPPGTVTLTDLWTGATSTTDATISATVPGHSAVLFRARATGALAGTTELVSRASGRCLDLTGGATTDGTAVIIWDCHGRANQQYTHTAANELRAHGGSTCLSTRNQSTAGGTPIEIATCDGSPNQKFTAQPDGSLRHTRSGRCLDIAGAATANGSAVILWDCHGSANQTWWRQ